MKKITIQQLKLENFMGIKSFSLDADGGNLKVYGDNGKGKTTLASSLFWLLFGKDSQNRSDFQIKPVENGQDVHMVDSVVEALLHIDGQPVKLRKTFREIWKKKRGSAHQEFSGHETVQHIDDVPKKTGEYKAFIESIIPENVFKLLTNPNAFNTSLKWTERRKLLLEIAGDVSDTDIMESRDDLQQLANALKGKSVEDFRLIKAERKKAINKELDMIPIRVDEIRRGLPDNVGAEVQLNERLNELEAEENKLREKVNSIRSGGEIQAKKAELHELENRLRESQFEAKQGGMEEVYKLKAKISEEQSNVQNIERKRDRAQDEIQRLTVEAKQVANEKDALLAEYKQWSEKSFEAHTDCTCPTCGQDLPEDQVNAAKEKALAQFNLTKSENLERIKASGMTKKQKLDELAKQNTHNNALSVEYTDEITKKDKTLAKLKESLESSEKALKTDVENPALEELRQDIMVVKEDIGALTDGIDEAVALVHDSVRNVQEEKRNVAEKLQKLAGVPAAYQRIDELKQQEEALSEEFERIEELIYLTEEFMRAKVDILTDRINEKFEYARFKLFKQLVQGNLEETCETTVNGVSYDKGLNNAAKINAGLDIVRVLSEHYQIKLPAFLDNAESVVSPIDTGAQMIHLIVSEQDKELRVEKA